MSNDDVLSSGWKMFQLPDLGADDKSVPENLDIQPGDMALGTKDRVLVVIRADGTLKYGPDYTPDEAAQVFWTVMARKRVEFEETLALHNHLKDLVTQIGEADLDNEKAIHLARGLVGTPDGGAASLKAFRAHAFLEGLVHQVIELGRGLAKLKRGPEDPD